MESILYVDDLLELNFAYASIIENSNKYNLIITETPEEALISLRKSNHPSCVVLDLDMPVPDIIEEPLRSCWQRLGEPENSYGLVIAEWISYNNKSIIVIILSAVPARFDDFRDQLNNIYLLDRLTHTPDDLLETLDELLG
jgi:CheY-like chemotaxis protein